MTMVTYMPTPRTIQTFDVRTADIYPFVHFFGFEVNFFGFNFQRKGTQHFVSSELKGSNRKMQGKQNDNAQRWR